MAISDDANQVKMDVYARPFVPQSLRNVNLAPANLIRSEPAPWIDFTRYVQSFAGSDFMTSSLPFPTATTPGEKAASSGGNGSNTVPDKSLYRDIVEASSLAPQVYHDYFQNALKREGAALTEKCGDHALFRVPLAKKGTLDPRPSMYSLHVPGLREMSLHIEVGDIVQLRQIRFNQGGEVMHGSLITDADGKPIALPRHADNQYNSVVWGIDRQTEMLSLRIDNLAPRSMLFNVQFTVQVRRVQAFYMAVIKAQHMLNARHEENWTRSMLFPEQSDGYYQKSLNKATINLDLFDRLLNYEQIKAVNTVLNEQYGTVPFIISGPPGTGKTKTIVELALQMISKNTNTHLLVCAPSDPAADTLVQRMSKHLQPSELTRINSPSRSFPEVPDTILPYCYVDDGMFSLPSFRQMMGYKAVVTTCRDVQLLLRARLSNRDLDELQMKMHTTIHPHTDFVAPPLHWTGLLIDEAAQATEPEALLPLSFVTPPNGCEEDKSPILVMAGDQHQLGPRTASKAPSVQTSLFERLLDRPFYRDHPLARSKQSAGIMRPLTSDMLPIIRPAFTNLIRNYRSHPAILATPSTLFYNDTLEPEATDTESLLSWPRWKGRKWPVLFNSNSSPDEIEQDGGGWFNVEEAHMACRIAKSFLEHELVQPKEICIISPFAAQVRLSRKTAREAPYSMSRVNIGPLEAFQGLESKLVILCTTRTRDRFLDQDIAKGLGVIHEPKRFNVALTRAMSGLIVIGNPDVLVKDKNWRAFLRFIHRNELCDDLGLVAEQLEEDSAVVSRLERQLIHRDDRFQEDEHVLSRDVRKLGLVDDPEHRLWESGVAAEEMIRKKTG